MKGNDAYGWLKVIVGVAALALLAFIAWKLWKGASDLPRLFRQLLDWLKKVFTPRYGSELTTQNSILRSPSPSEGGNAIGNVAGWFKGLTIRELKPVGSIPSSIAQDGDPLVIEIIGGNNS